MVDDRLQNLPISTVKALIGEQFPEWRNLTLKPVRLSGWDNHTFHLGEDMLVRLPSASRYEPQVEKEHEWLPKLSKHLSYKIPEPVALGKPNSYYPWHWSVYKWIGGKSLNFLEQEDVQVLAADVAHRLIELHQVPFESGPTPGAHNFYRGAGLSVYNSETRAALKKLTGIIDVKLAGSLWDQALQSKWGEKPLWVHGDYSAGNILAENGRIIAVIDFGCMGIGDPACDLVIAWTAFTGDARRKFKESFSFDLDTWVRAKGWALWKALITLVSIEEASSQRFIKLEGLVEDILAD